MRRPAPARLPSAIEVSVDLPMPGEPPSSTSEPGHEAAAEHAVELADPGLQPRDLRRLDVGERDGLDRAAGGAPPRPRRDAPAGAASSASVFHSAAARAVAVPLGAPCGRTAEQTKS